MYLQFAHWADTQSLEHPNLVINLKDWLGLKSGVEPLATVTGGLDSSEWLGAHSSSVGGRKPNLCNKTEHDSVVLLLAYRSQPDICTMFPSVCICSP